MDKMLELFTESVVKFKNRKKEEGLDIVNTLMETAEQVILNNGMGKYEREFNLLKQIVQTTEPVEVSLANPEDGSAWQEMLKRAIDADVVEGLTADQKENMLGAVTDGDDGLDIWLFINKDSLTEQQIAQVYLAGTISFYYIDPIYQQSGHDHFTETIKHLKAA